MFKAAKEKGSLTLTCKVIGLPVPEVKWFRSVLASFLSMTAINCSELAELYRLYYNNISDIM